MARSLWTVLLCGPLIVLGCKEFVDIYGDSAVPDDDSSEPSDDDDSEADDDMVDDDDTSEADDDTTPPVDCDLWEVEGSLKACITVDEEPENWSSDTREFAGTVLEFTEVEWPVAWGDTFPWSVDCEGTSEAWVLDVGGNTMYVSMIGPEGNLLALVEGQSIGGSVVFGVDPRYEDDDPLAMVYAMTLWDDQGSLSWYARQFNVDFVTLPEAEVLLSQGDEYESGTDTCYPEMTAHVTEVDSAGIPYSLCPGVVDTIADPFGGPGVALEVYRDFWWSGDTCHGMGDYPGGLIEAVGLRDE